MSDMKTEEIKIRVPKFKGYEAVGMGSYSGHQYDLGDYILIDSALVEVTRDRLKDIVLSRDHVIYRKTKPKRWRAKNGKRYYYITSQGQVCDVAEMHEQIDNQYYKIGNYFETEEEAQEMADKINALLNGR